MITIYYILVSSRNWHFMTWCLLICKSRSNYFFSTWHVSLLVDHMNPRGHLSPRRNSAYFGWYEILRLASVDHTFKSIFKMFCYQFYQSISIRKHPFNLKAMVAMVFFQSKNISQRSKQKISPQLVLTLFFSTKKIFFKSAKRIIFFCPFHRQNFFSNQICRQKNPPPPPSS